MLNLKPPRHTPTLPIPAARLSLKTPRISARIARCFRRLVERGDQNRVFVGLRRLADLDERKLRDQTVYVVADADGPIFLPDLQILAAASNIRDIEKRQAESMRRGISLREQTRFELYLRARQTQPGYGFREHLRTIGRAIEE
jgi:hypothetical protein